MKFNKKQRVGIITLIIIILSIQIAILNFNDFKKATITEERKVQLEYYNSLIDSIKNTSVKKEIKYFKFNPNKLSYNSWSFFGLTFSQLYSLDSFRSKNDFSSRLQVKQVLKLDDSIFSIIDSLMYFPKVYTSKNKSYNQIIKYTDFNPNLYNQEDWMGIGFSKKQSEIIFNYIQIRGGIKDKEELKDVFVINDKKYNELSSFVKIPKIDEDLVIREITLNSASLEDFKTIKGLGDVYSEIIVNYRESLGGFKYYYQLKETNIVDSVVYELIKNKFSHDKDFEVTKLNINSATLEELESHPYIGWRLANSIVDFRTNFRDFNSLEELKNIEVISDVYFDKIELYLTLE